MLDLEFPNSLEEALTYLFLGFLCMVAAAITVVLLNKHSKKEMKRAELLEKEMKELENQEAQIKEHP